MEKPFIDRRNPLHDDINNRLLDMMNEDHTRLVEQRDRLHKILSLVYNELQHAKPNPLLDSGLMNIIKLAINPAKQYAH
ncbi:MAG: hypothetical protein ABL868_00320 [Sulfuriferula sp.]